MNVNLVARMIERAREATEPDARPDPVVIQGRFARDAVRVLLDDGGGTMSAPTPTVSPELKVLMRKLQPRPDDRHPARAPGPGQESRLAHTEFLEQLFTDEVTRRDADSAGRGPERPASTRTWCSRPGTTTAKVTYDRAVWSELISMRFVEQARNAFILGPVGVGKTFMATALGHIACRRRISVHFERADKLHKRLKAARLDASFDAEMRKLIGVDLLIIDDFALTALDATETADIYELCRRAAPHRRHGAHLQPGPERMAGRHGRSAAGPVGRRPAEECGLGAHHRGRVLPPAREAGHRRGADRPSITEAPAPAHLTLTAGRRDHHGGRRRWARGGPMLLATGWSLGTGKRHTPCTQYVPDVMKERAPLPRDGPGGAPIRTTLRTLRGNDHSHLP